MSAALRFLEFDYSEDADGHGTFDAMASVGEERAGEVQAEIDSVLAWAERAFPGARGALDEGAHWDYDLQHTREDAHYESFALSLGGTADFCAALRERFGIE